MLSPRSPTGYAADPTPGRARRRPRLARRAAARAAGAAAGPRRAPAPARSRPAWPRIVAPIVLLVAVLAVVTLSVHVRRARRHRRPAPATPAVHGLARRPRRSTSTTACARATRCRRSPPSTTSRSASCCALNPRASTTHARGRREAQGAQHSLSTRRRAAAPAAPPPPGAPHSRSRPTCVRRAVLPTAPRVGRASSPADGRRDVPTAVSSPTGGDAPRGPWCRRGAHVRWGGMSKKYCKVGNSGVQWRPCSARCSWGSSISRSTRRTASPSPRACGPSSPRASTSPGASTAALPPFRPRSGIVSSPIRQGTCRR